MTASVTAQESFDASVTRNFVSLEGGAIDLAGVAGWTDDATNSFSINGINLTTELITAAGVDSEAVALALNDASANTGVEAFINQAGNLELFSEGQINIAILGDNTVTELGATLAAANTAASANGGLGANEGSLILNGFEVTNLDVDTVQNAVAEINTHTASTGVVASIDDNGEVLLESGSTITVQAGNENGKATAHILGIAFTSNTINTADGDSGTEGFDTRVINPQIHLDSASDQTISLEVTTAGAAGTGLKNLNTELSSTVTGSAISSISVATVTGAQDAIDSIDQALETINETRSGLGAVSNRLDFTVSNLANVSENTASARSRVVDADFAAETASLSRAQVLQQASQAMLAQANARPQQVLSLLQ